MNPINAAICQPFIVTQKAVGPGSPRGRKLQAIEGAQPLIPAEPIDEGPGLMDDIRAEGDQGEPQRQ